jgi:hypothetical protein
LCRCSNIVVPSLFMCSAELGVGVGDCGDWVSWRGRPLFEGGRRRGGSRRMGPRCSKLPRELLLWLWFRLLGARTGQVNVGFRVVIDKQASLAFFLTPVQKDPFLVPRTTLDRTIALRACHHPSPSTLHPAPMEHAKSQLLSLRCSPPSTPHRTAPHHSLPSTPLHTHARPLNPH